MAVISALHVDILVIAHTLIFHMSREIARCVCCKVLSTVVSGVDPRGVFLEQPLRNSTHKAMDFDLRLPTDIFPPRLNSRSSIPLISLPNLIHAILTEDHDLVIPCLAIASDMYFHRKSQSLCFPSSTNSPILEIMACISWSSQGVLYGRGGSVGIRADSAPSSFGSLVGAGLVSRFLRDRGDCADIRTRLPRADIGEDDVCELDVWDADGFVGQRERRVPTVLEETGEDDSAPLSGREGPLPEKY